MKTTRIDTEKMKKWLIQPRSPFIFNVTGAQQLQIFHYRL